MAIQVAGELYESITGQLFEIGRQLRQPNGYAFDPEQLKTALQNAIEGKFDEVRKQPLLSVVATTQLDAIAGKSTKKCFIGSRYAYRDADFDNWLQASQPSEKAGVLTTLATSRDWTFREAAASVLGVGVGMDVALFGKLLVERGHTITLAQAEVMVEKTERGEKTGMRTNGWGNFFFVETGNEAHPVSVADVYRDERGWRALADRLDYGSRWGADSRLLVRNLDALKL